MNDQGLPPLLLDDQKRQRILAAIEATQEIPQLLMPGDVTVKDICETFHTNRWRARSIMRQMAKSHPEKYQEVLVKIPDAGSPHLGYVIREIDPSLEVPNSGLSSAPAIAGSKS